MPQFNQGERKTAIVTMTNPTEKAFDYVAELYMGTDLALMASTSFHLEAGESKDISLDVTMPIVAGTYPVNIAVFSGGEFIPPVYAGEDITIVSAVPSVTITDASWTYTDRPYKNYWGENKTARFFGGVVTVTSDSAITGCKVKVLVPGFISSVKLMTEAEYQDLLAWLDEMIATSTGSALTLYTARKSMAQNFPQIDGWREDYRWVSDPVKEFYTKIQIEAYGVEYQYDLAKGTNSIPVAFYQLEDTGLVTVPATISLYDADGVLLTSTLSSLPESAEGAVAVRDVSITSTTPGGIYTISADVTIQNFTSPQVTLMTFEPDISLAVDTVHSVDNLTRWIDGYGGFAIIKQPVEAKYIPRRGAPKVDIPVGTYPVKARAQIWRGYTYQSDAGTGVMLYGDLPVVFYDLGVVGTLEVVQTP